jgi:lysozyme
MPSITPRVIDISHHNLGPLKGGAIDFEAVAAAGIWGVICKASEGAGYGDPTYAARRTAIKAAGLAHGAYHFNTGEPVAAQVDRFFREAQPDASTCMVLDFEKQPIASKGDMGIGQAVEFLHQVETRLGRKAKIYSGNRLRETIGQLSAADRAYVRAHDLWYCQYGPAANKLPAGFSKYWLWQYTGDGLGPPPHSIPGVTGAGIDLNVYDGTREQLMAEWSASPAKAMPVIPKPPEIQLPPPGQVRSDLAPTFWGRVVDLFKPKGS